MVPAITGAEQGESQFYEGIDRQVVVIKDCKRDTASFAIIDKEWPALREAYTVWLARSNFTATGQQRGSLADLTWLVRAASDPLA